MDYNKIYTKNIALFTDIAPSEISSMLDCLGASIVCFKKGEYILMAGELTHHVGILLSGQATIYKDDVLGNRSVIATLTPPDLFAESFVCAGITTSPVTVEASADCEVLRISFHKIVRTCSACCTHHNSLVKNMLSIIARKNLALNEKIDHVAKKTTRQKLASYLLSQAEKNKSDSFSIGLDRQALSEYLCVNRSALSRELSKICSDGIVDYKRNHFTIHSLERLEDILLTD